MIRLATTKDIDAITATYTELLTYEQAHGSNSNWTLGVYPTRTVPEEKIPRNEMYVLEEDGDICASYVLNSEQASDYKKIAWLYDAPPEKVLVIHTLCVPPSKAGKGYATQMINFAKKFAAENNYAIIRIDTFAGNDPAKRLYQKNGFRLAGKGLALHMGLIEEELVYLEYKV